MPSIADLTRRRRPRRTRTYTNDAGDWLTIAVAIAAFVGLLAWMLAVAT